MNLSETTILIIRFWHEPAAEGRQILRGSIESIRTGEKVYFQTGRDLREKIDRFLTNSSSGSSPEKGAEHEHS